MISTYGIMNLIISIIVEQTLRATHHSETRVKAQEERARQAQHDCIRDIFLLADEDVSGTLSLEEFLYAAENDGEVQFRLRQLDLPIDLTQNLFQVLDGGGSRELTMHEFLGRWWISRVDDAR